MLRFYFILFVTLFSFAAPTTGQSQKAVNSGEILLKMKKLNVLGNALYLAAHPDDENTTLISYLSYESLLNTGYLSLTRGDGGQNLVGKEIREELGLIRTNELLAARATDGGQQFFSRANDFGYSKTSKETLKIWDKQKVLHDMVKVIRTFRPDVIITRFPPDARAGHGHHTSSAMLALEAFDLAANSEAFPEQLKTLAVWKTRRVFVNTGPWWEKNLENDSLFVMDIGGYNPEKGQSYAEISALSRSQHKSQGFGVTPNRNPRKEYLKIVKGDVPTSNDPMDGLEFHWNRIEHDKSLPIAIDKMVAEFNPSNPSASIKALVEIRAKVLNLQDTFWKSKKLQELDRIIADCIGLHLETNATDSDYVPGDSIHMKVEITNRSKVGIKFLSVGFKGAVEEHHEANQTLEAFVPYYVNKKLVVSKNAALSQPYWLQDKWAYGMYVVQDKSLIGKPMNEPVVSVEYKLQIEDQIITYSGAVDYKWNDRVKGECHKPLVVMPPFTINFNEQSRIINNNDPIEVQVAIRAFKKLDGVEIKAKKIDGWSVVFPQGNKITLEKGKEQLLTLKITPPKKEASVDLQLYGSIDNVEVSRALNQIAYDHLPFLTWFPESKMNLVKLNVTTNGKNIGYVMGAGDKIPASLRNIGYQVKLLEEEDFTLEKLAQYDAVVFGIRAFNTKPRIELFKEVFMEYVKQGGNCIVQYNTRDIKVKDFFPYKINVSRDRVADETAAVTILDKKHQVFNYPNKISTKDFDNWVQERGLYFPNEWDDAFVPVLSMHDEGETPKKGSLLIAQYGSGFYVHTGLSWFRELPAGVPGAYRLFVNILSLR